jgi:hypothetical protein
VSVATHQAKAMSNGGTAVLMFHFISCVQKRSYREAAITA